MNKVKKTARKILDILSGKTRKMKKLIRSIGIGMDVRNSEVGDRNLRTGKSLLGAAIVIPQVYISAKNKNLTDEPFLFEEVTEKHDIIFLESINKNN